MLLQFGIQITTKKLLRARILHNLNVFKVLLLMIDWIHGLLPSNWDYHKKEKEKNNPLYDTKPQSKIHIWFSKKQRMFEKKRDYKQRNHPLEKKLLTILCKINVAFLLTM